MVYTTEDAEKSKEFGVEVFVAPEGTLDKMKNGFTAMTKTAQKSAVLGLVGIGVATLAFVVSVAYSAVVQRHLIDSFPSYKALGALTYKLDENRDGVLQPSEVSALFPDVRDYKTCSTTADYKGLHFSFSYPDGRTLTKDVPLDKALKYLKE